MLLNLGRWIDSPNGDQGAEFATENSLKFYVQTQLKNHHSKTVDAKNTPCYSSGLYFSDFQDKSEREALICSKIFLKKL